MIAADDKIYIPEKPLKGLDVSYYSSAILTGAGSFSREAAVIGTPAVSFFAGKKFLGVDKEMFKQEMVYFSRKPDDIITHILKKKKKEFNISISKATQENLYHILEKAMI